MGGSASGRAGAAGCNGGIWNSVVSSPVHSLTMKEQGRARESSAGSESQFGDLYIPELIRRELLSCRARIGAIKLREANVTGQAESCQQPDSVKVGINLVPSKSVPCRDRVGVMVIVPALPA